MPSHAATALHAGPVNGKTSTDGVDVKSVPSVMVSNPAVKNIGGDTVGFASGTLGILKLLLTEHALEALSFTPYPGLEETAAKVDTTATDALAANLDTARQAGDDAELLHAIGGMATRSRRRRRPGDDHPLRSATLRMARRNGR